MHLGWGDFELDEARFELRKRGKVLAVQPKVLDLVLYLAKHRSRVVGKDELLDRVWQNVTVTDASLSQAVSLARRALDDTPEAQHTLRTVRGKGLQFVAPARQLDGPAPPPVSVARVAPLTSSSHVLPQPALGSSVAETKEEAAPRSSTRGAAPCLFLLLHCDLPTASGARWVLEDVDEVVVARGSTRRAERMGGVTRTLVLRLLDESLSREHAKLTRGRDGWYLVDSGSRNGTLLNGARVTNALLSNGDQITCGRSLLWFQNFPIPDDLPLDQDLGSLPNGPITSLMPDLWSLSRDLSRLSRELLPLLLLGETGVGKERVARAMHHASGRAGSLVLVDGAERAPDGNGGAEPTLSSALAAAAGGTLLIEHVDRMPEPAQATLIRALDSGYDVRVIATSNASAGLGVRPDLLARLSGYRATLPPLRERIGDFGVLIAELAAARNLPPFELDVAAARALLAHSWPGNVRELDRCLQVATTLARGQTVRREHLPIEIRGTARSETNA